MEKLKVGKSYKIHSYKHNGMIYKSWDHAIFLDYRKKEEVYVFVNDCANVLEMDVGLGRLENQLSYSFIRIIGIM